MSVHEAPLKWGRIVAAGVAAQFADDLVFALVPPAGWLLGAVGQWLAPALTILFALWVARSVPRAGALRHGAMVGAVSGALTFLVVLPGWWAPLYGALTAATGALGGILGGQLRPDRARLESRDAHG